MVRHVGSLAAVLALVAVIPLGCGGLSTEDATLRCDQERTSKPCVTDASYGACITCYEECGDDCNAGDACPETYACPE
jgi:hypothetical protein